MNKIRHTLQILLPLVLLAGGALLAQYIVTNKKAPAVNAAPTLAPWVRVHVAAATDLGLHVDTQGTVEPFRVVDLTAQVGGRVLTINPALRTGGSCNRDDVLLEIDDTDLRLAFVSQQAAVARAELHLLQEKAEADAAARAWQQLEGERQADPLVTRGPQIHDAEAALNAARAQLERSQLDLTRTKILAPVAGRVRSVDASVGQTVQPGQQLAVLLDTSCLEVRLPIPVADAAFLDLPFDRERDPDGPADVTLTAEFAGRSQQWPARVVRTEGEIDRRSRQLTVVVRVAGTQASADENGRPPLLIGMFVQARIEGRSYRGVVTIPRAALRDGDSAWIVVPGAAGGQTTLQHRQLDVLRTETGRVVLRGGLQPGELVCVSRLDTPTDNMLVRIQHDGDK